MDSFGRYIFIRLQKIYLGDDGSKRLASSTKERRQSIYFINIFDHYITTEINEVKLANWYTYSNDAPYLMSMISEVGVYEKDKRLERIFKEALKWSTYSRRVVKRVAYAGPCITDAMKEMNS